MKFNVLICVLFIILFIPSVQAGFNNPGFETGNITDWTWVPQGTSSYEVSTNYAAAGSYGLLLHAQYTGGLNKASIYQSIDTTGYNYVNFDYWLQDGSTGWMKILDAYSDISSTGTRHGEWRAYSVNVAAYGVMNFKVQAHTSSGEVSNYLWLDNFELSNTPRTAPITNSIFGTVKSSAGPIISAAIITLNNSGGSTTSNDTGYYSISDITAGTYTITATSPTHEDYSDTVSITSDTEKNITMTRLTPTINNQGIIDSSESSLRIGWRENPVVDSVKIYQGTDTNLIQTENTQYISIWSYTVDNLNADTGYNFWLQPYDGAVAGAKYYVTGTTLGGGGGGGGAVPPADPTPDGTPTPTITPRPTPGPTPPPWTNITEDEWTELTITEQEYILLEKELQDKLNATGTYTIKPININLWWLILLIGIGSTVYGSQKEKGEFLFVGGIVTVVIAMLKLGLF